MAFVRGRTGKVLLAFSQLASQKESACVRGLLINCRYARMVLPATTRGIHVTCCIYKEAEESPAAKSAKTSSVPVIVEDFKDRFVPLTRLSIIRHLMQQKGLFTQSELKQFETFATALDTAIVHRYHGLLSELKTLFDPINPDKDTIVTRKWGKRERMDNEFWLLQKLAGVMERANFHEISPTAIKEAMKERLTKEGVLQTHLQGELDSVSMQGLMSSAANWHKQADEFISFPPNLKVRVNTDKYAILRMWALGQESEPIKQTLVQRMVNMLLRRPPPMPTNYYKRVVVAVRLHSDDKLLLKAFKEVPIAGLSKLLPDGSVKMSQLDRIILGSMGSVAAVGVLAKIVTLLAGIHFDWSMLLSAVTVFGGVGAWTTYKQRHLAYINDVTRTLYFKNIANNRGLLTLLIDRAEDEIFKEALLVYSLILGARPPSAMEEGGDAEDAAQGSMAPIMLEKRVQEWVEEKTKHRIDFSCDDSVRLLKELGLMSEDYNSELHVLSLDAAIRNLPLTPQSLAARGAEPDIVEGYDHDALEETEDQYKEEEKKRKKYGWF